MLPYQQHLQQQQQQQQQQKRYMHPISASQQVTSGHGQGNNNSAHGQQPAARQSQLAQETPTPAGYPSNRFLANFDGQMQNTGYESYYNSSFSSQRPATTPNDSRVLSFPGLPTLPESYSYEAWLAANPRVLPASTMAYDDFLMRPLHTDLYARQEHQYQQLLNNLIHPPASVSAALGSQQHSSADFFSQQQQQEPLEISAVTVKQEKGSSSSSSYQPPSKRSKKPNARGDDEKSNGSSRSLKSEGDMNGDADELISAAEVKLEKRNKQTRDASRLYRQRKRMTEQTLNDKVSTISAENEQLLRERQTALARILALRLENEQLRKGRTSVGEERERTRGELLRKLALALRSSDEEENSNLELAKIIGELKQGGYLHCESGISPGSSVDQGALSSILKARGNKRRISGDIVDRLIGIGTFKNGSVPLGDDGIASAMGNIQELVEKVVSATGGLSSEQEENIDSQVRQHQLWITELAEKRRRLASELEQIAMSQCDPVDYFITKTSPSRRTSTERSETVPDRTNIDSATTQLALRTLKSAGCLERIAESLEEELKEWTRVSASVIEILTPRQHAQLILRVEYETAVTQHLKSFWNTLCASNSYGLAATLPPPPPQPELQPQQR